MHRGCAAAEVDGSAAPSRHRLCHPRQCHPSAQKHSRDEGVLHWGWWWLRGTPGSPVHAHACCCLFLVAGGAAVHQVWCCGQGARPVSGRHSGIRVSAPRAVLRTIHGTPRHGPGHSCAELPSQPRGPVDRAVRGGDPPAVRRCPAASRCCGHAASPRIRNRWRQAHHHVRGAGVASVQ